MKYSYLETRSRCVNKSFIYIIVVYFISMAILKWKLNNTLQDSSLNLRCLWGVVCFAKVSLEPKSWRHREQQLKCSALWPTLILEEGDWGGGGEFVLAGWERADKLKQFSFSKADDFTSLHFTCLDLTWLRNINWNVLQSERKCYLDLGRYSHHFTNWLDLTWLNLTLLTT